MFDFRLRFKRLRSVWLDLACCLQHRCVRAVLSDQFHGFEVPLPDLQAPLTGLAGMSRVREAHAARHHAQTVGPDCWVDPVQCVLDEAAGKGRHGQRPRVTPRRECFAGLTNNRVHGTLQWRAFVLAMANRKRCAGCGGRCTGRSGSTGTGRMRSRLRIAGIRLQRRRHVDGSRSGRVVSWLQHGRDSWPSETSK